VELSTVTKSRVLAACWQLRKFELADHLVSLDNHFNIPEVLKALKILGAFLVLHHALLDPASLASADRTRLYHADGPRRMRALEKKIARLEKQATAKPKTLGLVRAKINDLKKDVPGVGSSSPQHRHQLSLRACRAYVRFVFLTKSTNGRDSADVAQRRAGQACEEVDAGAVEGEPRVLRPAAPQGALVRHSLR
jgi:hypothetical protein